ncbi:hypothetical protein LIT38_02220 [Bacillus sp. CMF12]|uniref:hypothetical protein n=1 Tax=Bacillus sp. CMF12 TaxID=2884834 RepID=UPI00207A3D17|nr:hypothetical protein [Bacillus sp. CMF12]USK50327.1 hypothetical protein LIT38_02220 [Bacillus sp. CMF12]
MQVMVHINLENHKEGANELTRRDEQNKQQAQGPKEERELVNEFGKHEGNQPVPQPKDYDEIEY